MKNLRLLIFLFLPFVPFFRTHGQVIKLKDHYVTAPKEWTVLGAQDPSGLPIWLNADASGNLMISGTMALSPSVTVSSGTATLSGTAITLTPVATLTSGTYTFTNLKSLDLVAISGTSQLVTATGTNSYIAGGTPSGYSRSFAPDYVESLSVIVSGTAQVNHTK